MILNESLLNRTLDYIEEHPDEWEQRAWRCGTRACFAGHAALLAGCRWFDSVGSMVILPDERLGDWKNGDVVHVEDAARFFLGITSREADWLFYGLNTMADLEDKVQFLIGTRAVGAKS